MSRALPPLKGHLRKKVQPRPKTPPLPDNPYKRFFTENRSFEELARKVAPQRRMRGKFALLPVFITAT